MPGSAYEAGPETPQYRVERVKDAVGRLQNGDFGLRTDEAIDLTMALMVANGINVSAGELKAQLERLMRYNEPDPG